MQYKTFIIPVQSSAKEEEELNAFLRSNKIITVSKEFLAAERIWCFLVEYVEDNSSVKSTGKVDYMKILSAEDFAVFSKLRTLRRDLSQKEKIPAYAVFTDEQLYKITKENPKSIQDLQKINGIGQSKAEKYGVAFIKLLTENPNGNNEDFVF